MQADGLDVEAQADGGLNMNDEILTAGIKISNAGYGDFELEYERNQREQTFKSADRPASHETDRPSTLEDLQAIAQDLLDRASEWYSDDE
jgi:hypothetical protein